ncbi:uncharacterized protein LOC115753760 [Rhodamnia argentea]|uniref:Uncharacterized protein LOC115753760 n=1 Tax=Rhodamnia argentea TaxID=178133 RepID=A0A8B8QPL2_9MYRT|nr:uncharacterized protein LOC115753760 [Rhodamnia argentea]XP_030548403.1 uncharacterized protein LOC115753760 [Rhodamnia argentea]XP_030548404.1 uncharacterized protein LOC115753760 [Rhodamnia argentea]XP_030548407.1 uncharacterized protein LOC115753760 [Rhodamnia argentea]XP_048132019.1 uncharacterized protein LOC115753760 [Rhodamnia argentea]
MEERKLNFNSPLLSARRYSMPASSSSDKGRKIQNSLSNRWNRLPSSDSDSNMDQVTEPVAVPFTWEHIPGKAKDNHEKSEVLLLEGPSVSSRLPPRRSREFAVARHLEGPSSNNIAAKLDSFKQEITDEKEGDFEEDDDEDAYSDAVETLSPTESLSFSVNYSVSGLSGADGPVVKPSGTFLVDSQTKDFMMSRFLPAARAMALEPPQYSSRKQPATTEQTRDVKKLIVSESRPPPKQYSKEIVQYYKQDAWEEESVDDDEDKGKQNSDYGSISAKGCGLLPRLCLLNPIPGMKSRASSPMSFMSRMKGVSKDGYARSQSQPISKKAGPEHKLDHGNPTPKLPGVENRMLSNSSRFNFSGELRARGGLSPFRRSRNDGVAPQQNGPALPPPEGFGFLGLLKEANNIDPSKLNLLLKKVDSMQKVSTKYTANQSNGLVSPAAEKTLYVDAVNIEAKSCYKSSSYNLEVLLDCAAVDVESHSNTRKTEEHPSEESSFQDIECLDFHKSGTTSGQDISVPIDANSSSCFATLTAQEETMCISAHGDSNINTTPMVEKVDMEEMDVTSLPLPLLKSPSESWLWRTLPSTPSRHPLSHLTTTTYSKNQDAKVSTTDTKWETIVKTSNLHHDHVRYSQELISHVLEQPKF